MAPNKFENLIKKQLEEREIKPSSDAWLKLSERLDEAEIEQPKKRRSYFWYAVAACLIGLIVLSTVFYNSTSSNVVPSIQVVEDEQDDIEEVEDFQKSEIENDAIEVVSNEKISEEKKESSIVKANVVLPKEEKFVEQFIVVEEDVKNNLDRTPEEIINTKILQVVAQVDILEKNNEALTDAEVDSLLRKAQTEILKDKLFRSDHSVDALALLSEVENELDKSFRDQIFESLKRGFVKVRTAVADRNN